MKIVVLAVAAATRAGAFLAVPVPVSSPAASRASGAVRMELSEYEKYRQQRGDASFEEAEEGYKSFKGMNQEFDGGDSGGGVVGDGNVDLEDQHNSPTLGALRGGIADATTATMAVGRGNVNYIDLPDEGAKQSGATEARTASAGKNYFGRSTGLAEKIIDNMSEEDVKMGRIDCVRAQQKENWFNQRAIHRANRAQGQGVVFGESTEGRPSEGGYVARDALDSAAWRNGAAENEISQADLSKHLSQLASLPAERLDGQEWGELVITEQDEVTEMFEVRASPRQTHVTTINVKNDYNTFAPYRCNFVYGSSACFSVTPNHGTMNRRSGDPVEVIVRYTPESSGEMTQACLVFETEDMKKIYSFTGST